VSCNPFFKYNPDDNSVLESKYEEFVMVLL